MFKIVLCHPSFPLLLRDFFRPANPQNNNFDKMQKREKFFVNLTNTSHFIKVFSLVYKVMNKCTWNAMVIYRELLVYIFNQFAKRNETFIIRVINTSGTSGQNLTSLRR